VQARTNHLAPFEKVKISLIYQRLESTRGVSGPVVARALVNGPRGDRAAPRVITSAGAAKTYARVFGSGLRASSTDNWL